MNNLEINYIFTNKCSIRLQMNVNICDALRDLVPFVQFKKRKNLPGRRDTLSKVAR